MKWARTLAVAKRDVKGVTKELVVQGSLVWGEGQAEIRQRGCYFFGLSIMASAQMMRGCTNGESGQPRVSTLAHSPRQGKCAKVEATMSSQLELIGVG